jgi:carboxyl-terminal processing protease
MTDLLQLAQSAGYIHPMHLIPLRRLLLIPLGCAASVVAQTSAAPVKPSQAPKPAPTAAAPKAPAVPVPVVQAKPDDPYAEMVRLTLAMETVRDKFVDSSKITYKQLVDGALEGMLRSLDPHCDYMKRDLFEDVQREQADTSEGVGITVAMRQGVLVIASVREDGPAAKGSVRSGDQLLRINDALTDKMGLAEVMRLLKGKAGEKVKITVRRPSTKQFLEMTLVRAVMQDSSVVDALMLHSKLTAQHKIGYARLTEFTQATTTDLSMQLDKLEAEGMQALVLDLRNNPGGLLDTAISTCGEFLPEGTLVVTTEGRKASEDPPPYRTPARKGKSPRKYPLVVIVNHDSASASEILAAVLQDLRRAIVVGTQSFGKGSVQTLMPMKDGSALRLTTARYFTPSHRTIHEQGVTPNIVAALNSEEEAAVQNWRMNHSGGESAAWELATLGDKQLERAVDVLKGIMVYQSFQAPQTPAPVTKPIQVEEPKLDALLAPTTTTPDP